MTTHSLTSRCKVGIVLPIVSVIAALLLSTTEAFHATSAISRTKDLQWKSIILRDGIHPVYRNLGLVRIKMQASPDEPEEEPTGAGLKNLIKDTEDLVVGDWVVAKRDVPSLGIGAGRVYKILAIFLKGAASEASAATAESSAGLGVEVIPLERYGDDEANSYGSSYTKYLRVYNPRDHDPRKVNLGVGSPLDNQQQQQQQGVVVTPEEIGLVSVKADWTEALFLAVPGFFWVVVAMAFSNYYTDRYGGSFWDAFFRT